MKKIIVMVLVMGVLFAISAGSSWMLRQSRHAHDEHAETTEAAPEKGHKAAPHPPANTELRPAVRPPFNAEADSTAQLANSLRVEKEALREREQKLIARQKSIEIICQDIRSERTLIDDMRKQLNDELKTLAEKVQALERKASEVEGSKKRVAELQNQLDNSRLRVEDSEKDTVKRLAVLYDGMDSDAAAQQLQHMADTGKMETAVKILAGMRERQAAKVLAAFPDRTTVVQLVERMRTVDRTLPGTRVDLAPPPGKNE